MSIRRAVPHQQAQTVGEELIASNDSETAAAALAQEPDDGAAKTRVDAPNRTASDAIEAYVKAQDLKLTGLTVTFDGARGTATVFGVATDQATKEKVLPCCRNVGGVTHSRVAGCRPLPPTSSDRQMPTPATPRSRYPRPHSRPATSRCRKPRRDWPAKP